MIINEKLGFVFIHIPKTAGTSVASALSKLESNNIIAINHNTKHETYHQIYNNYSHRTGRSSEEFRKLRALAFCRNPWSRFLSLHRYIVQRHREKYPMIPENVNGFSRILADNPDWSLNIRSLLPQSTFIKGAEDNLWIGRFENLEEDFGNIMRTFGINCTLPHKNHSGSLHEDYKVELDSFSEDFIRSKHNEDIKRFGYSF